MNLRAPFRVASFAIRMTSKIRSGNDFRYKYGWWKSVGERPQEILQEKLQGGAKKRHERRSYIREFVRDLIVEYS